MTSPVVANGIYVILGASGNTGSIIANDLLLNGKRVRVVGRDAGRLQPFVDKGARSVYSRVERCGCAQQSLQQ
jgi:short-subunit dehydrogenase